MGKGGVGGGGGNSHKRSMKSNGLQIKACTAGLSIIGYK